jgi:hypothetical protein
MLNRFQLIKLVKEHYTKLDRLYIESLTLNELDMLYNVRNYKHTPYSKTTKEYKEYLDFIMEEKE